MQVVQYNKRGAFHKVLCEKVKAYFDAQNLSRNANARFYAKAIAILVALVLMYAGIYLLSGYPVLWYLNWVALGVLTIILLLNIMHDALHGTISSNPKVNNSYGIIFKILGLNDSIWKHLHNLEHHNFTNIEGGDPDLLDNGYLRFSPYQKLRPFHKYQHIYASVLYALSTIYWVFQKDVGDVIRIKKLHTWSFLTDFIFFKLVYLTLFLLLPMIYLEWDIASVILGFVFMHITFGLISSYIFLSSHIVDEVVYFDVNNKALDHTWAEHQLLTTITYGRKKWLLNHLSGGINYQIEHHLFPAVCHVHLPAISQIVKDTALEFNLEYLERPSFRSAIISHLKALKKLGSNIEPDAGPSLIHEEHAANRSQVKV